MYLLNSLYSTTVHVSLCKVRKIGGEYILWIIGKMNLQYSMTGNYKCVWLLHEDIYLSIWVYFIIIDLLALP